VRVNFTGGIHLLSQYSMEKKCSEATQSLRAGCCKTKTKKVKINIKKSPHHRPLPGGAGWKKSAGDGHYPHFRDPVW